jgi:UDP-glucose 4-epimerase
MKYEKAKKGDIKYSQADISQAENDLGYSPKFKLDKIKEMLE